MYSLKRYHLPTKSNDTSLNLIKQTTDFSPNENGIYVPTRLNILKEVHEQNIAFAKYSYIRYPYQIFKKKLTEKLTDIEIIKTKQTNTLDLNIQIEIQSKTKNILKNTKKNIENLDKKFIKEPIQDQSPIPKLNNISDISKTLYVLYFNIHDKKFTQDINSYISVKSFFHVIKESPHFKKNLVEIHYPIFKNIITNIDNIYNQTSLFNLKKALYSMDSNMPFYFSNESGFFRSKEFMQTIECVHSDIMPGTYYIKTLKGSGDLYYKDAAQPNFLYVELKTADLPESHMDKLLKNIPVKYHMIKDLIICFDVKSQNQQDQIINYLIEHKVTNVTSIFINNSKFFSDHQFYNSNHAFKNPLDQETLDFFYNAGFKKRYMDSLEEISKKNKNKINLLESEDKLDQLVDPKVLNIIEEYQKVGNIFELINPTRLPESELNNDDFESNSESFSQ